MAIITLILITASPVLLLIIVVVGFIIYGHFYNKDEKVINKSAQDQLPVVSRNDGRISLSKIEDTQEIVQNNKENVITIPQTTIVKEKKSFSKSKSKTKEEENISRQFEKLQQVQSECKEDLSECEKERRKKEHVNDLLGKIVKSQNLYKNLGKDNDKENVKINIRFALSKIDDEGERESTANALIEFINKKEDFDCADIDNIIKALQGIKGGEERKLSVVRVFVSDFSAKIKGMKIDSANVKNIINLLAKIKNAKFLKKTANLLVRITMSLKKSAACEYLVRMVRGFEMIIVSDSIGSFEEKAAILESFIKIADANKEEEYFEWLSPEDVLNGLKDLATDDREYFAANLPEIETLDEEEIDWSSLGQYISR